jgi:hypothetical protein
MPANLKTMAEATKEGHLRWRRRGTCWTGRGLWLSQGHRSNNGDGAPLKVVYAPGKEFRFTFQHTRDHPPGVLTYRYTWKGNLVESFRAETALLMAEILLGGWEV